jgi:hypothetical protein
MEAVLKRNNGARGANVSSRANFMSVTATVASRMMEARTAGAADL